MIYEYECPSGHRTEVIKFKPCPDKEVQCPQCMTMAKRVFSVPAIVTTGEGFDETVGHFSSIRDKHEKMRLLGINQKNSCGSLTRVPPHYSIQDERRDKGINTGGE